MGIQDVQAQHQRDIERHQIGNMNAQQIEAQHQRDRVGNMNVQQIEAQRERDRHRGKTKPITPVRFDLSSTRKKKPRADGSENIEDGEEGSDAAADSDGGGNAVGCQPFEVESISANLFIVSKY